MKSFAVTLSIACLAAPLAAPLAASAAGPDVYHAYCLVVEEGNPPQSEIRLARGDSWTVHNAKGVRFTVAYGESVGRPDTIEMTIADDAAKNSQTTYVQLDQGAPKQIDLMLWHDGLSCWKLD